MPPRPANRNVRRKQQRKRTNSHPSSFSYLQSSMSTIGYPTSPEGSPPRVPAVPEPDNILIDVESPPRSPEPLRTDPEPPSSRDGIGDLNHLLGFDSDNIPTRGDSTTSSDPVSTSPSTDVDPLPKVDQVHQPPSLRLWDQDQTEHKSAHTRSPVLSREPTMLETFSRTVRNYVPSSIPIPTAAPSPPLVSRPVSFGSFLSTGRSGTVRQKIPQHSPLHVPYNGRNRQVSAGVYHSRLAEQTSGLFDHQRHEGEFVSDEDEVSGISPGPQGYGALDYPRGVGEGDVILWAKWDTMGIRRILFLAYTIGLQIWDCTDLSSIRELLNLSGTDWGQVTDAAVLPRSRVTSSSWIDHFEDQRPILCIITTLGDETTFLVYSLHRHHILKRLSFPGLATFSCNEHFIVISASNPAMLRILSSTTFTVLFTIHSSSLVPFPSNLLAANHQAHHTSVLLSDIEYSQRGDNVTHLPVFALSHRLLVYASPAPPPDSQLGRHPHTQSPPIPSVPSSTTSLVQAELGNMALKVGGTVLSGMKSLGGIAYSAAMSKAGLTTETQDKQQDAEHGTVPGVGTLASRFFSRSAPAASTSRPDHGRRYSSTSAAASGVDRPDIHNHRDTAAVPIMAPHQEKGYFLTVLDLSPLLSNSSVPDVVSEFLASKRQPITNLEFSGDGTSILVGPKDGQTLQVFQLRPKSLVARRLLKQSTPTQDNLTRVPARLAMPMSATAQDVPWHVYNLRRGRTSAVIEGINWAHDGRWIAIGTRKRTIHVFAVNPYGGIPDKRSHLEGHVVNPSELSLSSETYPLVRFRSTSTTVVGLPRVPLAFTFIQSLESSIPSNLLPPNMTPPQSYVGSLSSTDSEPISPRQPRRPTNFQDILVFDPMDGMLSLRRFSVELRTSDQGLSLPTSVTALGTTSLSLPKMSGGSRLLSTSPPNRQISNRSAGPTHLVDHPTDLTARESIIATWNLQRRSDWGEIRRFADEPFEQNRPPLSADWLSHAELSTFSLSTKVLPRTIYLSHQFAFHTIEEDYHALLRRFQFDITGTKIDVRREVEVSSYSAQGGESFVEGFTAPRDIRRSSLSFDEPLASALTGGLDYAPPPAILPMLPNGTPGSGTKSFRNSIPIRSMAGLSDGMTESLGRIRSQIHHRVRSQRVPPPSGSNTSGSAPLEFDEEDEGFITHKDDTRATISTTSGGTVPLEENNEDDDMWSGWESEDRLAIEEAERFDDISVVGFLDEEQASMTHTSKRRQLGRRKS